MDFKVICNAKRNFQALIELQSGHTYSVLFVQVFDIKQSYKSWSYFDIFIQNIYINICDIKQTYKQLIVTKICIEFYCNLVFLHFIDLSTFILKKCVTWFRQTLQIFQLYILLPSFVKVMLHSFTISIM